MNAPEPVPPQPADLPVFEAPWQAKAFALTVHLHARGAFTWAEWAAALSAECTRDPMAEDSAGYYAAWLRALENLLAARSLAAPSEVATMAQAWRRAARAKPHGTPIRFENARP